MRASAGRPEAVAERGSPFSKLVGCCTTASISSACTVDHKFPKLRARRNHQNGGGTVARPRAADDFPAIRARLEELRRERSVEPEPDDWRWLNRPPASAVG